MIRSISLSVIVVVLSGCAGAASRAQPVRDTVRVAAPTGERAADRASVQAAFDAVQPGGMVAFAAGTYVIGGDGLVLRTPGVALISHPASTTLQGCTPEQRIGLEALGADGACSSMVVAGNRIDGHTEAVAIAVFPQDPPGAECSHITIRDNEIVMSRVRRPDGSDQAGRLAIAPAIRLFNAQRLVGEGLITWNEYWMPEGGWPDALSEGRISEVSVVGNHITGAVGVAIEAAHVTDSRIVDNEIEVRPATTPEERDGLSVGGNGGPGVWVLLGLVDEVNGSAVWVSVGSEGTVVRPPAGTPPG